MALKKDLRLARDTLRHHPSFERDYQKALHALESIEKKEKKGGHSNDIMEGIPRGVWASHWANEQEEKGRSFSGQEITAVAPRTPAWAKKWAKKLADAIVAANHKSLEELYEMVRDHGYPFDREQFGLHLGMQADGHGISWSDDTKLPHDAIKIPRQEFYR